MVRVLRVARRPGQAAWRGRAADDEKRKGVWVLSCLHVVLVEPQIPQNTGNIARTCAATGAMLHIVQPAGFTVTDAKLKRAGLDYWHLLDLAWHESLAAFLAAAGEHLFFFSTKAGTAHSDVAYPDESWLVFGREDAGLPEELITGGRGRAVRLPMRGAARSLNLSNAVAVGVYEVLRQWDYPELSAQGRLWEYDGSF